MNYAGLVIHPISCMAKNAENHVVMNTHSRAEMTVAALEDGLQPISMTLNQLYDEIAYHDYEGVSIFLDERECVLDGLGGSKATILQNHGLLNVRRTVPEAFLYFY